MQRTFKSFKKGLVEGIKKWRDLPCSWIGKISIIKIAIFPKSIWNFIPITIKNPNPFFKDLDRPRINLKRKNKKSPDCNISSLQEKNLWRHHYSWLQVRLQTYSSENASSGLALNFQVDQRNSSDDSDIAPHTWTPDFWQWNLKISTEKKSIFYKWRWHNWMSTCRRMWNQSIYLHA